MLRFFIRSLGIDETSIPTGISIRNGLGGFCRLEDRFAENLNRKEGKFILPPDVDRIQGFSDGFRFTRMPAQASFDVGNGRLSRKEIPAYENRFDLPAGHG